MCVLCTKISVAFLMMKSVRMRCLFIDPSESENQADEKFGNSLFFCECVNNQQPSC